MTQAEFADIVKWSTLHIDVRHFTYLGDLRAKENREESAVYLDVDEDCLTTEISRLIWLVAYRRAKGLSIDDLELPDLSSFFGGEVDDTAQDEPTLYIDLSERHPPSKLEADELAPSGPLEALEGDLTRLQAKIDAVRAGKQELTPDELIEMHKDNPPGAAGKLEDAVRALKGEARRKLSELLNVELAELKNNRGMANEDRVREQQIEYLLGLFTRLGEI